MAVGLHHLRYFVAVAEAGSVSAAAARLHLAQPSLSTQIRGLEEELGVALLRRHPRGVALTPAGEAFLADARTSLAAAEAAVEGARRAARGETGRLAVGFIVGTQVPPTSRLLARFRERFPGVALEFREYDFSDPSAGLNAREVDLAFVMPPLRHDGLSLLPMHQAPRVAVLPDRHPLARRPSISVRDLLDETWIVAETEDEVCRDYWLAMPHRTEPPRVGPPTRSLDKFIQLAATGAVVGLAAEWVEPVFARPGVTFVPVHDVEPATTALAWWPEPAHPVVARFVEVARELGAGGA